MRYQLNEDGRLVKEQVPSEPTFIRLTGVLEPRECAFLAGWFAGALKDGHGRQTDVEAFNGRTMCLQDVARLSLMGRVEILRLMDRVRDTVQSVGESLYGGALWPNFTDLVRWPAGTSLGWHVDDEWYPERLMTGVLGLDDNWEGGETELELPGGEIRKVSIGCGELLVYRSRWRHRVLPIRSGTRHTIACWATPDFDQREVL